MKTWMEMTDEERRAAVRKGDAVPLVRPAEPTATPTIENAASALSRVPPGSLSHLVGVSVSHEGRALALVFGDGWTVEIWSDADHRLVGHAHRSSVDAIPGSVGIAFRAYAAEVAAAADPRIAELAKWRSWAVRLLGACEAYATDDDELRNQINAAPEPPTPVPTEKPSGPQLCTVVLNILRTPAGRAAIAECMRRPPVRMADGSWREPTPGSEAKPGDMVRKIGSPAGPWKTVIEVDGADTWVQDGLRRQVWLTADVEVVMPAEVATAVVPSPLAADRCPRCFDTGVESVQMADGSPGHRACSCKAARSAP